MTRHGRLGPFALPLILSLLALIPAIVFAAVPALGLHPKTEVVSGRTLRITDASGLMRSVPDLAVSGQVLARFWPAATQQQVAQMLATTGCQLLHQYRTPGLVLLGLPPGMSVNAGVNLLQGQGAVVRSASPDRMAYPARTPNDPQYGAQYQWPLIHAPEAWDVTTGSSTIVVGVVDSGIDLVHEDLASQIWRNTDEIAGNGLDDDGNGFVDDVNGWDFINGNNDPSPGDGTPGSSGDHGTHVAGLVGAATDNGVGVAGHAWNVQLMSVQVFNNGGAAYSTIADAYEYAVANGAQVINMSIQGFYSDELTDPITLGYDSGVVTVCAAGNWSILMTDDPNTWISPVCNDGPAFTDNHVLGVGASDSDDVAAGFSNLDGSSRDFVDVMAPGVNIWSTLLFNPGDGFPDKYGSMSGTSMASPIVAGLAALVRSKFAMLTPDGVMAQIKGGCDNIDVKNPGHIGQMGAGRINSNNSLGDRAPGPARSVIAFDTPGDSGGSITVSWGLSIDDGRGFNDVTGYEVWRATDPAGTFEHVGDVAKGLKTYADTSVIDYQQYYYIVYCLDAANRTASRVTEAAAARDDTPPDPVIATAKDTPTDSGGSITITWAYTAPPDLMAYRVYRATAAFSDVSDALTDPADATDGSVLLLKTITDHSAHSYQDKTTIDDTDYYYAVTAVDTSQPANEDTAVTASGPVRSNPNYAFSFPPGLVLMGIGLGLQNNDLADVFDVAGGVQFARWDPSGGSDGAYVMYSPGDAFMRLQPGRGFWMRNPNPTALSLSGAAAAEDVRVDFAVGWNQLANPYVGDVTIVSADDADTGAQATAHVRVGGTRYTLAESNTRNLTRDYFWTYDTATNSYRLISDVLPYATNVIAKGQGFFFMSNRTGQLVLTNPTASSTAAARPVAQRTPLDGWSMRLMATIDGAADTDNFLGVSSRAEEIGHISSPPPASDGPDLYFTTGGGRAATDFVEALGQGHSWTAAVSCSRPGARIHLSWPDLSAMPRDCRPTLTDESTGRPIYMRTASGYDFTLGPRESSRQFTIRIGTTAGDTLAIEALQAQDVGGNVSISYLLAAPAAVSVEIRNLAGRLVRRLSSDALNANGANTVTWNLAADAGQRVPAGRYVVCVRARAENGQVVQAIQSVAVRR